MSDIDEPSRSTEAAEHLVTSDPAVLRALAHPLRVEILSVLDELREATATEIAERVGASPSNCSFHLRQLERAGYIASVGRQGRSRPWRPVHRSRNLAPDPSDPMSVRSSQAIGALYVQHEANRVVDYLTTAPPDPEWADAVTVTTSTFWATAAELRELAERIGALTEQFHGRDLDPSARPPGSRRAHFLGTLNPEPERRQTAAG